MNLNGKPFNPGDLHTRILLQSPVLSKDAGGAQKPVFSNATNPQVLARWINAHGQENVQNAAKSTQRATVTIRYREDIQTTWQVVKDGNAWQILSIDDIQERHEYLELIVERTKGTL